MIKSYIARILLFLTLLQSWSFTFGISSKFQEAIDIALRGDVTLFRYYVQNELRDLDELEEALAIVSRFARMESSVAPWMEQILLFKKESLEIDRERESRVLPEEKLRRLNDLKAAYSGPGAFVVIWRGRAVGYRVTGELDISFIIKADLAGRMQMRNAEIDEAYTFTFRESVSFTKDGGFRVMGTQPEGLRIERSKEIDAVGLEDDLVADDRLVIIEGRMETGKTFSSINLKTWPVRYIRVNYFNGELSFEIK